MKPTICFLSILLISLGAGCAKVTMSQELERIDGGMQHTTKTTVRVGAAIHEYTLPEKRSIQRILIYTTGDVKQLEILAQQGQDYWKPIKQVAGRTLSPIEVRASILTNGIRIIQPNSLRGEVQRIELYGVLPKPTN